MLVAAGYVDFTEVLEGFAKVLQHAKNIDMQQALVKTDGVRQELSQLKSQLRIGSA